MNQCFSNLLQIYGSFILLARDDRSCSVNVENLQGFPTLGQKKGLTKLSECLWNRDLGGFDIVEGTFGGIDILSCENLVLEVLMGTELFVQSYICWWRCTILWDKGIPALHDHFLGGFFEDKYPC